MPGYHVTDVPRGEYGTAAKVYEEAVEFIDAVEQYNPVMALQELSDLIGAVRGYLGVHHPTICLNHLIIMADATTRAFEAGDR